MEQAHESKSLRESGGGAKAPDRWFLHVQGRTLGPLAGEEVAFGLKTGEFLPSDKIANSRHPIWRRVAEHPVFGKIAGAGAVPRSKLLQAPPPPRLLRVKAVPPTVLPESVPARPVVEAPAPAAPDFTPVVEIPKEATSSPPTAPETAASAPPAGSEHVAPPVVSRNEDLPQASPPAEATPPMLRQQKLAEPEPDLEDPETNAALEAATRELDRVLSNLRKPEPKAELKGIPSRPEVQPIFLAEPAARKAVPAPRPAPAEKGVIRIELKMPQKAGRWLLLLALLLIAAWHFGLFAKKQAAPAPAGAPSVAEPAPAPSPAPVEAEPELRPGEEVITGDPSAKVVPRKAKKTRDLKEFPLSDPSSPTNTPPDAGDPIPRLKAPVRPQRD